MPALRRVLFVSLLSLTGVVLLRGDDEPVAPDGKSDNGQSVFERIESRDFQSSRTTISNGVRHITVNSPRQKVEIEDRMGQSIEVKIHDKATDKVTTFRGNDIEELRKESPEAAKLYEQHTKPSREGIPNEGFAPGFGVEGPFPGGAFPRAMPLPGGFPQYGGTAKSQETYEQLEACLDRIIEVQKALSTMKKETFDEAKSKELAAKLDQAKKDLFAIQAKLKVR